MQDIGVLFLVEHVARELDVVTYLIHRLKTRYGITAAARSYYHGSHQSLAMFKPRVVVFPFFYGADHLQPARYATTWPSARLVNLGWEQILNKLDINMKVPRDDIARTRLYYICWSLKHMEFLLGNGIQHRCVHVTGCPVMQLYAYPYRRYFKTREQLAELYGLDATKKWILFSESYQFALFSDQHISNLIVGQNADPELIASAAEYGRKGLMQLLRWTNDLVEDDVIFILRPRPSTTETGMIDFMHRSGLGPNANMRIIQAETAREWILAADHVMSSHSTTLIEAALAGKPIHRFSPEPTPDAVRLDWHDLVPLLSDRAAFAYALRDAPLKSTSTQLADWARSEFLSAGDPLNAVADCLVGLHEREEGSPSCSIRKVAPERQDLWDGEGTTAIGDIFHDEDVATRLECWRRVLSDSEDGRLSTYGLGASDIGTGQ